MICLWLCGTEVAFDINDKASLSRLASQFPLFSSRDQQAAVGSLLRMEVILPNASHAAEFMTFMNTSTSNQRPPYFTSFLVSLISSLAGLLLEIDRYFDVHSQALRNARIQKTLSTAHVFNLESDRFCLLVAIIKNRQLPRQGSPAIISIASVTFIHGFTKCLLRSS